MGWKMKGKKCRRLYRASCHRAQIGSWAEGLTFPGSFVVVNRFDGLYVITDHACLLSVWSVMSPIRNVEPNGKKICRMKCGNPVSWQKSHIPRFVFFFIWKRDSLPQQYIFVIGSLTVFRFASRDVSRWIINQLMFYNYTVFGAHPPRRKCLGSV